ncbi:polysaccharide pyruvyl transferase family protein [Nocardioides sp. NPDC006273]|uniref:polysaccharide pyruvyl transferase family protein n=1 Tax=Nocardioides sp. NPDC006273 TaxID=3155598 RepID=UPI0033BF9BC4
MEIPLRRVVTISPLLLSDAWSVRREPPRPAELRQADYLDKFDDDTLVYDAFPVGDTVRLSGPPLLNLASGLRDAVWRVGGAEATGQFHDLDRTQASWLDASAASGEKLTVTLGGATGETVISESGVDWFRGHRVLVTKSKNNDLQWIADWARFHAAKQGINAVLIYDNDSDRYRPEDVLEALDVPGIEIAVVVAWPFKFGPQGGNWHGLTDAPWDSDFCQYGILEHARHRFLSEAAGVLNHDIDELAVSEDDAGVFEVLAASESGAIRYPGRWIDTPSATASQPPRFSDFTVYDTTSRPSTGKWAIDPMRTPHAEQWKTHSVPGIAMVTTKRIRHRHFTGITSGWKYARGGATEVSATHRYDIRLADALVDVFGPDSVRAVPGVVGPGTTTALLEEVERRLSESTRSGRHGPGHTLVLDYESVHGVRYAYEITATPQSISLEITAADDASWYTVRKQCSPDAKAVPGTAQRLQLGRWKSALALEQVVDDLVDHIRRTNTDLNRTEQHPPRAIASYWWDQRPSFGDQIGPWLIEAITGLPAYNSIGQPNAGGALMTTGSLITEMQRPDMTIWGSGLIAPLGNAAVERLRDRKPREVLAVRGARTRNQLVKHLDWDVPEVYGDPALLMPYVLQPGERPSERSGLSIIPHRSHARILPEPLITRSGGHPVDVRRPAREVVEEIAQSEVVVSTSLHGLILAHAYGIPWVWLHIIDKPLAGDRFTFSDFFTTLEKEEVASVSVTAEVAAELDLERVVSKATLPGSKFDSRALVEVLPYDIREDFLQQLPRPRRSRLHAGSWLRRTRD